MNYKRIYDEIINNRIINKLDKKLECVERHHIIPRCVGGTDEKSNIVSMTPREHFLCHLLLTKIYNDKSTVNYHKLLKAFFMMFSYSKNNSTRYLKINSKMYEKLRVEWIESQRLSQAGENNSQFGSKWINDGVVDKKIISNEVLPEGFVFGRIKKIKVPKTKRIENQMNNIILYTKWFKIYKEYGFKRFSEIVGYTHSSQNLGRQFAKYVEDFIPNNPGVRRCAFKV